MLCPNASDTANLGRHKKGSHRERRASHAVLNSGCAAGEPSFAHAHGRIWTGLVFAGTSQLPRHLEPN